MTEVLKGVMKLYESKNSKTYRIMCDCIGKDCDMYMEFEIDNVKQPGMKELGQELKKHH